MTFEKSSTGREQVQGNEPWRSAAQALVDRHDVEVRNYRGSMSGVAFIIGNEIEAPEPRGAKSFAIFAHEVGHQVLHDHGPWNRTPRWREEIEAWDFALAAFKEFGLRGQRKLIPWVQNKIARAVYRARVKDRDVLMREFRRDYPKWAERVLG